MRTNITTELVKAREEAKKELSVLGFLKEVKLITNGEAENDLRIAEALGANRIIHEHNLRAKQFQLEKLEGRFEGDIFTIDQIKALAEKYDMRFLPRKYYSGEMPVELIGKLKQFNKEFGVEITKGNLEERFSMLAPEKQFTLNEQWFYRRKIVWTDPAMFYNIDDTHFRLIHQWGTDFTILDRIRGFKWSNRFNHGLFWAILTALFITLPFFAFGLNHINVILTAGIIGLPLTAFSTAYWDEDRDYSKYRYHANKWNSPNKVMGEKIVTVTKTRMGGEIVSEVIDDR